MSVFKSISGNPKCPVASLEKYLNVLHPECDAFFQRPLTKVPEETDGPWYANKAVGHNKLGAMMAKLSKQAALSRVYTNHCVRATCITLLDNHGFESRHIMGISKHKAESSLKHYSSRLSEKKRVEASDILLNACRSKDNESGDKENIPNIIQEDLTQDPLLLDFLSSSQEDYLLSLSDSMLDVNTVTVPSTSTVFNHEPPAPYCNLGPIVPQAQFNPAVTGQSVPQAQFNPAVTGPIVPQAQFNPAVTGPIVPQAQFNPAVTGQIVPQAQFNPAVTGQSVPQAQFNPISNLGQHLELFTIAIYLFQMTLT